VRATATFDAPVLTTVGGYVYVSENATFDAPVLTTVGGYVYVRATATFDAPVLTTVGGSVDVRATATFDAPVLTTVGGSVDVSENATFDAPVLKTKTAGEKALSICRTALTAALARNGLVLSDGILACPVSTRGNVSRIHIVGQTTVSYIVRQGEHTAHGATIAEARADLILKMGGRDTTPYKEWTKETKVSLEEMIVAYRTITGACGKGVGHFLSSKSYKGKLSVAFVIAETEGKYGHEAFKGFFNN